MYTKKQLLTLSIAHIKKRMRIKKKENKTWKHNLPIDNKNNTTLLCQNKKADKQTELKPLTNINNLKEYNIKQSHY